METRWKMDDNYLKIIKQLGVVYKDRLIDHIEYRRLVRKIDAQSNDLKNSKKLSSSLDTIINLKEDLKQGKITEKFFICEKDRLLNEINDYI